MAPLRTDHRPPKPGPQFRIVRVKTSSIQLFTSLSASLWGCWTHWSGSASQPCLAGEGTCPGCRAKHPSRWKGYLHVWDHQTRSEAFLELTPSTAESLLQQAPGEQLLRGLRLSIKRSSEGNHGRLTMVVNPAIGENDRLPPQKGPEKILTQLWDLNQD